MIHFFNKLVDVLDDIFVCFHIFIWLKNKKLSLSDFEKSYFYSDSHNDLPLLKKVTHPVVVDSDDILKEYAKSQGWPQISLR